MAPDRWSARVELSEESAALDICTEATAELIDGLATELRRRQKQVADLSLRFEHRRGEPTVEHFDFVKPLASRERLLALAADRLERLAFAAPVTAIELRTGVLHARTAEAPRLFVSATTEMAPSVLIERLRERFGEDGVHGVALAADHRPERAWSKVAAGAAESKALTALLSPWASSRPLWLLPEPLPLASAAARRLCCGAWQLRSEAERIESGWWDGSDVRRDYHTAVDARGQKLWVYRDRVSGDWHLHGFFG
jgi:protein ImuB